MQPYWATFAGQPDFHILRLGAGVTAHSPADAKELISIAFGGVEVASLSVVRDVNSLDAGHVRPNMGNIFQRGVWFPLGHEAAEARQSR